MASQSILTPTTTHLRLLSGPAAIVATCAFQWRGAGRYHGTEKNAGLIPVWVSAVFCYMIVALAIWNRLSRGSRPTPQ